MSFGQVNIRERVIPGAVASVGVDVRMSFIRKTYATLAVAIFAFVLASFAVYDSGLSQSMVSWLANEGGGWGWLLALGAFMVVGHIANKWAHSDFSAGMQYLGLALYVVAEALIFGPLLYVAAVYAGDSVIPNAAALTILLFAGLTGTVFITKKDFSFIGGALRLCGFAALGVIVLGMIFGFTLGLFFAVLMVGLSAGYVLYYTSQVLAHYRPTQHVAAALALFSAIALMFYYVLIIVMNMSDD